MYDNHITKCLLLRIVIIVREPYVERRNFTTQPNIENIRCSLLWRQQRLWLDDDDDEQKREARICLDGLCVSNITNRLLSIGQ